MGRKEINNSNSILSGEVGRVTVKAGLGDLSCNIICSVVLTIISNVNTIYILFINYSQKCSIIGSIIGFSIMK